MMEQTRGSMRARKWAKLGRPYSLSLLRAQGVMGPGGRPCILAGDKLGSPALLLRVPAGSVTNS